MFTLDGKYTTALFTIDNPEPECISQVANMANHAAFSNRIVLMPDVHAGKGSCIGFTMPLGNKVIPNVVGVDIGCGVAGFKFRSPINLEDASLLSTVDDNVRQAVPFGFHKRNKPATGQETLPDFIKVVKKHKGMYDAETHVPALYARLDMGNNAFINSLGTLGGGNHFIELGRCGDSDEYWIFVHSGSRNFGKRVCDFHQDAAVAYQTGVRTYKHEQGVTEILNKYRDEPEKINMALTEFKAQDTYTTNKQLAYLEGEGMDAYLKDMRIAQIYAAQNRMYIVSAVYKAISSVTGDKTRTLFHVIDTVHNFIDGTNMIRKGAVRALEGEQLIIPFNMRDGAWICRGRGNKEWNYSAPHGAGRVMSRTQAKKVLSLDEAREQMKGIYTSCIPLDEAPGAYKDASTIKKAIGPTIEVLEEVRPILNMKAK